MSATRQGPRKKAAAKATGKPPARRKARGATKTKAPAKSEAKAERKTRTPTRSKAKTATTDKAPVEKSPANSRPRKTSATATTMAGACDLYRYGVAPYQPKKNEAYMSDGQLAHFRTILVNWKHELLEGAGRTIHHLQDDASKFADSNDRASQETDFGLELKARDRERRLIRKIDAALERISQRTYGYCEETGEEIGLRRLEARPIATLCLEAQERHEKTERHFGSPEG